MYSFDFAGDRPADGPKNRGTIVIIAHRFAWAIEIAATKTRGAIAYREVRSLQKGGFKSPPT
ncbi:MAG: hypothetical protein GDA38_05465 [Hormoscilla sp. SP12CHS1]|nr:hypothetical protein [Hormoscilla sp. SP12CHS1]